MPNPGKRIGANAMIYEFQGQIPVVHQSAFIHPQACVTGNVVIGRDVYVGPGAALRGDWGLIVIEHGANVQENCVIHTFPGTTVTLRAGAHIGHGAVIHGARVGENVLVGMNAVLMDDVVVGDHSIIGALTLVPRGMVIAERKVVAGNPARIVKDVTEDMIRTKTAGTDLYRHLPAACHATLRPCEPLRETGG
jgi:carbonic anhydrase/acetyltransferase-like protein (isoleucine patch superfamily)